MGKPYSKELLQLRNSVQWADAQDVSSLRDFLYQNNTERPLICIGSGGSLSACFYAALLYKLHNGILATAMTPLELMYSGQELIRGSKLLYLSASGKNKDILNAIKYGVKLNEIDIMSLSLREGNPTEKFLLNYPRVSHWCKEIPTGKDGFLATNSLVATFSLLSHAYDGEAVAPKLNFYGRYRMTNDCEIMGQTNNFLDKIENFIVLYGAAGESVARDIESKFTEAALGCALLSDYRNFGHGRHHWFAKRLQNSCIIALVTPIEKNLATKTIECLPKNVPIIYLESDLEIPRASIDLLIKALRLVEDLGVVRGIDPGRPGVPSYGSQLYNLNYFKLLNNLLPAESILDLAVKRKIGTMVLYNQELLAYFQKSCKGFVQRLNNTYFTTLAFDYDGTLSESDHTNRYRDHLCDAIIVALESLLQNGIEIRIATGRGKSVGDVFRNSIKREYWSQIKIGYYNGACLIALDEDNENLVKWKNNRLDEELLVLKEELKQRIPNRLMHYLLEERNKQLSITLDSALHNSDLIFNTCREIIWDKKLNSIHVWRSSHSMDVVVCGQVNKLNVLTDNEKTLKIGDYGNYDGNDYEFLSTANSLSVDKVSCNADSCWNIAPSGLRGLYATIYYLSRMTANDGKLKCKFSI